MRLPQCSVHPSLEHSIYVSELRPGRGVSLSRGSAQDSSQRPGIAPCRSDAGRSHKKRGPAQCKTCTTFCPLSSIQREESRHFSWNELLISMVGNTLILAMVAIIRLERRCHPERAPDFLVLTAILPVIFNHSDWQRPRGGAHQEPNLPASSPHLKHFGLTSSWWVVWDVTAPMRFAVDRQGKDSV